MSEAESKNNSSLATFAEEEPPAPVTILEAPDPKSLGAQASSLLLNALKDAAGSQSIDNGSPSIDNGSPSIDNGSPSTDNGSPSTDNGSPFTDNGSPFTDNGAQSTDNGSPFTDNGSQSTDNGSPSVFDGSPSTENNSEANTPDRTVAAALNNTIQSWDNDAWHSIPKKIFHWLWNYRAPFSLILVIAFVPKLIILWVLIVLAKPVTSWMYQQCPQSWKSKFKFPLPAAIKNSPFWQEFNEGADQSLPFILFCFYMCCAPFAILWMAVYWVQENFRPKKNPNSTPENLVLSQNKRKDTAHSEDNFYYSPAFGIVLITFFALGLPAFFSYSVYEKLGIEKLMESKVTPITMLPNGPMPGIKLHRIGLFGYRSSDPAKGDAGAQTPSKIPERTAGEQVFASRKTTKKTLGDPNPLAGVDSAPVPTGAEIEGTDASPIGEDATVVMGYNGYWPWLRDHGVEPSKSSVFFVHFYLMSLAAAICILFFRAWFSFPLNFLSDEHDLELNEFGVRRKSMKSWFFDVLTLNRWATGGGPDRLHWQDIKSLRQMEEGFTKMCPLPETAFKKESLSYKLLNKVAALIDGISNRLNSGNYLIFSTAEKSGDFGRNIRLNLNDLTSEQRARLFYSVKKWAPHVVVMESAEEKLLGSTVLKDNRYTQLWFDMMTSRTKVKRQHMLNVGESLRDGAYTIDERLSAGGQATAYLAKKASGEKVVLKEFILASSSSSAALLESAKEFEAEVSMLSQLNHPGIVKLEDFFTEDGRVYVVLEHIEGQSLKQKVQLEGPLSEKRVAEIGQSVCVVLEYLHACIPAIVHRDITPENILIRPDGTIKLIDFSLAVKNDGRRTTDSCAKQCFTPPEQFREEVCTQSDIYALGATLYYLLTGSAPKPISCSSPAKRNEKISKEMDAIVERATQLDLNQRYESANWLRLDLAKLEDVD